jgi:trimeric autotransporter adhesin
MGVQLEPHVRGWSRPAIVLAVSLLLPLALAPSVYAGAPRAQQPGAVADLTSALAPDGTFVGAPGLTGIAAAGGWTLTSDIESGEPPRFEPASQFGTAGSWEGLGSGPGNGALNDGSSDDRVDAIAMFGSNLIVGGTFKDAAGIPEADYIAQWNGTSWSALGSNGAGDGALSNYVRALVVSGGNLYVGGGFYHAAGINTADFVARWNGTQWSALGNNGAGAGALSNYVAALAFVGSDLYVGGGFQHAGGIESADYLARWTGSAWSSVGDWGTPAHAAFVYPIAALAASGTDLYVGGYFENVGDKYGDHVVKWSNGAWSSLGDDGIEDYDDGAIGDFVYALAVFGNDVYVGGSFTNAGGLAEADHVARWNSTTGWSALGNNGSGVGALTNDVWSLAIAGTDVYVGGWFTNAGGVAAADRVARWSGAGWFSLGDDGDVGSQVSSLFASGSDVYVGGRFLDGADLTAADYLAKWNGSAWLAIGGHGGALGNSVMALAFSGSDLYVSGFFKNAAGIPEADYIARWDGLDWHALGDNGAGIGALNGPAGSLAVSGTDIYVGGAFTNAAGIAEADYVALWDGSSWFALGSAGAGTGALNGAVSAIAISGSDIYVGGSFTNAGAVSAADSVACWCSSAWTALGGVGDVGALTYGAYDYVSALAASGDNIYVGGYFENANAIPNADYLALWDGDSWSAVGSNGGGPAINDTVYVLATLGGNLYAGGYFTNAGGTANADQLARWNGSSWTGFGDSGDLNSAVRGLAVIADDDIVATGSFTDAAGKARADYVAHWNGSAWSNLGGLGGDGALNYNGIALGRSGGKVVVGGDFVDGGGVGAADFLAAYTPAADVTAPTVGVPTVALKMPQQIGPTASLQVSWSAASDPSGIDDYELQYKANTGAWNNVPLSSPTATSAALGLPFGNAYQFRLRATDAASNTGLWATTPSSTLARKQEKASAITYTGTWKRVALSGASGGYVKKSGNTGARATFSFSGRTIGWVSTLGPDRGKADVWLDGVKVATIDLYTPTSQKARLVWTSPTTGPGSHSLQIRVLGTRNASSTGVRIDLDCLLVLS